MKKLFVFSSVYSKGIISRAKVEYLLSGKLFCGYCGEKLVAVGGTSRNGEQHHYYKCKKKGCEKKAERKDFLEWMVCQHILDLLNMEGRKEILADKVIEAYKSTMEVDRVSDLEKQLNSVKGRLNHVVDLLIEHKSNALIEKMENLELQKSEIEEQLYSASLSARHVPTRANILEWFDKLKNVDEMKQSLHKQVINTFVHKVFLWNDKMVVVFTLSNTQETVGFEEIREFEALYESKEPLSEDTENGSYNKDIGSPSKLKSEPNTLNSRGIVSESSRQLKLMTSLSSYTYIEFIKVSTILCLLSLFARSKSAILCSQNIACSLVKTCACISSLAILTSMSVFKSSSSFIRFLVVDVIIPCSIAFITFARLFSTSANSL